MNLPFNRAVAGIAAGSAIAVAAPQADAGIVDYNFDYNGELWHLNVVLSDDPGDQGDIFNFGNDGIFINQDSFIEYALTKNGSTYLSGSVDNATSPNTVGANDNFFQDGMLLDTYGYDFTTFDNNIFEGKVVDSLYFTSWAGTDTFGADVAFTDFMNENAIENIFDGSGTLIVRFGDGTRSEMTLLSGTEYSVVPTPGALALLGMAGVAATARRRDNTLG